MVEDEATAVERTNTAEEKTDSSDLDYETAYKTIMEEHEAATRDA